MALTKDFKDTIFVRAQHDAKFRRELLTSAINELLSGDVDLGKAILRDYVNATVSFKVLANAIHKNSKSLQRMLSTTGNPTMDSLCEMLTALQKIENIRLSVSATPLRNRKYLSH